MTYLIDSGWKSNHDKIHFCLICALGGFRLSNTVLIVDDDKEIAKLIEVYLNNEGYHVLKAQDGNEALKIIALFPVDIIVLDVMDGLELCKEIRKVENYVAILMLSEKVHDMDKITGLMTGADDYMIKPFNPLELTARVKALIRRLNYKSPINEMDNIVIHKLEINQQSHRVTGDGKEIKLTSIEFDILLLLAKNQGRVFSSEEIYEIVWKERSVGSSKTVMVHISNIRDKIEAILPGEEFVKTVWGVGYKIEKANPIYS